MTADFAFKDGVRNTILKIFCSKISTNQTIVVWETGGIT
jgi:hypothetical protein